MRAKFLNEVGKYWDQTSKYATEQQEFWNELVPAQGEAETLQGEILRSISRIMYDYYNNGFGNNKKEEAMFLDQHALLFKSHMKNPDIWDHFFEGYQMSGWGEGVEGDEGGYDEYDPDTGEYEWVEDEDNWTSTEDYLKNVLGLDIDGALDDIMDGVVKYIRLTYDNLVPLT